jgi:hypothetical protein
VVNAADPAGSPAPNATTQPSGGGTAPGGTAPTGPSRRAGRRATPTAIARHGWIRQAPAPDRASTAPSTRTSSPAPQT